MQHRLDELFKAYRQSPSPDSELALWEAVRRWAMREARHDEDLAQDIVVAANKGHESIAGSLAAWLKQTARNIKADRIRRLAMIRSHGAQEVELNGHDASLTEDPTSLDLEALTPDEQHLADLILRGYSIAEIAQLKGVTASGLRKQLYRIRSRHVLPGSTD